MTPKVNFHTHTVFCDGKNTVEEMVISAVEKGFSVLGFSGHSYTVFDERYCMSKAGVLEYREEVERCRKKYKDQIDVYCGVEQDFYSEESITPFSYAIGSVHYTKKDGKFILVDETPEIMARDIKEEFGGDAYAYAELYFQTVGQVLEKTKADFVGHFDLVTKFNEGNCFFDTKEKRYRNAGLEAIENLLKQDKPFEINSGGIFRGYRKEGYPSVDFLKELHKRKGKILFSSDSHDVSSIDFHFDEMERLAKAIGFTSRCIWTPKGMEEVGL